MVFGRDEMTTKKTKTQNSNIIKKICYNGYTYSAVFRVDELESSFKYCPQNPVKVALVEITRTKND